MTFNESMSRKGKWRRQVSGCVDVRDQIIDGKKCWPTLDAAFLKIDGRNQKGQPSDAAFGELDQKGIVDPWRGGGGQKVGLVAQAPPKHPKKRAGGFFDFLELYRHGRKSFNQGY